MKSPDPFSTKTPVKFGRLVTPDPDVLDAVLGLLYDLAAALNGRPLPEGEAS